MDNDKLDMGAGDRMRLWAVGAVVVGVLILAVILVSFMRAGRAPGMLAPVHRTSASEVENADGSPVNGRNPADMNQQSLSDAASRPGVFAGTGEAVEMSHEAHEHSHHGE